MENLTIVIAIEWDFTIIYCFFTNVSEMDSLVNFKLSPAASKKTARFKSGQNLPKNNQLDSLI